jgi:hypothetical protein
MVEIKIYQSGVERRSNSKKKQLHQPKVLANRVQATEQKATTAQPTEKPCEGR